MRPVDQTIFGAPEGNCLAACVATLLDLSIDDVPHFGADGWAEQLTRWLRPRGLYALHFSLPSDWHPRGLYILAGQSPRGDFLHAVVARGGDVIHDPHPSRAGLLSHVDATVLTPLDPSTVRS